MFIVGPVAIAFAAPLLGGFYFGLAEELRLLEGLLVAFAHQILLALR